MAPVTFSLREPRTSDVDELARVHVDAWRETYEGQLPEEFFDEHAVEFRRGIWRRMLTNPTEGLSTVLAEDEDSGVIGFAAAGPPVSPEPPPLAAREVYMIYLLAGHHGSGAGQAMLDAVLGSASASLWVAARNPRAHRFYERNGFRFDGVEKADERVPTFLERRMVRP